MNENIFLIEKEKSFGSIEKEERNTLLKATAKIKLSVLKDLTQKMCIKEPLWSYNSIFCGKKKKVLFLEIEFSDLKTAK